jgi:hypothetical protein
MPLLNVRPVDPLNHAVPIVDEHGRPTPQFSRQWQLARTINLTTDDLSVSLDDLRELIESAQAALASLEAALDDLEANTVPTTRQVNSGDGLTGGGDLSTNRTLALGDTAVTPGSYGSATHVARITIDQKGRITAAEEVEIT